MLDNRLKKCAELVSGEGIAVDVGTDHAYLAAELLSSGRCEKVIACDINEGPLEAAARTIEKCGISDRAELILSDGLKNVPLDGVTDVIIAGMGGETIARIISEMPCDDTENIRFILQPMTKPEILRRELYKMELQITYETVVEESGRLYVVMCAEYNEEFRYLTEFEAIEGFFGRSSPVSRRYLDKEYEKLSKISESLKNAGKFDEAVHYNALGYKIKNSTSFVELDEICAYINELYPFDLQESWDNSGLLVDSGEAVDKILLTLDITERAVNEASCKGAELIISHHPVIFKPLSKIVWHSPVYRLVECGISALCIHTNLDIAEGGTNGVILQKLLERFSISAAPEPFEELSEGSNLGWIVELDERMTARQLGEGLKEIFGCKYIRATDNLRPLVKRIAFCSGSGGSLLGLAIKKKCDVLVTGDVKHDVWIDAENDGRVIVFDCGHFHTENLVLRELRRVLEEKFPQLDIEISERSTDPCEYI